MNYDLLWSKVLENIKESVTSLVYITWFENTKLHKNALGTSRSL